MAFPLIVSADDHVVEPPDLWTTRLPQRFAGRAPHVVRERGRFVGNSINAAYRQDDAGEETDVWEFEDVRMPMTMVAAAVGFPRDEIDNRAVTYDQIRPGCFQREARLADMETAGIEASLCFPNMFTRFCGQRFLHASDKDLALACVRAYNDFIIDEWTAGEPDRLIPSGIVPLWDVELAAAEVRRNAERGMRAIAFSEQPPLLDLPSIYTDAWDPLFQACADTGTVVMAHIGSSSTITQTSPDAPSAVYHTLNVVNSAKGLVDWLCAGMPARFPDVKLCLAECQIGWIPYFLDRLDNLWEHSGWHTGLRQRMDDLPSTYFRSSIYVTFFDDAFGVSVLDKIGPDNVLFETDYPHGDSYWPDCQAVARKQTEGLDAATREKVLRGNARRIFRLD